MKQRFPILAFSLILLTVYACSLDSSDKNPSVDINTDKEVYTAGQDSVIEVEIVNNSDQTIYYSTCFAKELEILKEGTKVDAIPFPVCECICPAVLEIGEKIPQDITNVNLEFILEHHQPEEGETYRLLFQLFEDEAWGNEPLPENERRTNDFDIILN